jgi:hypothetical protein
MSDEEEYEYGMLDDGFTGVFEEEDLRYCLNRQSII